jgi:hypothetical protein
MKVLIGFSVQTVCPQEGFVFLAGFLFQARYLKGEVNYKNNLAFNLSGYWCRPI